MAVYFNLLLVICIVFAISRMLYGNKVGMTGEIKNMFIIIISSFLVVALFRLYKSIVSNNQVEIILTVIILAVISLIYKVIRGLFSPIELLARLPLIDTINSFLGIVFGLVETIVLMWVLSAAVNTFDLGPFGAWVRGQVSESPILAFIFKNNYLGMILPAITDLILKKVQ